MCKKTLAGVECLVQLHLQCPALVARSLTRTWQIVGAREKEKERDESSITSPKCIRRRINNTDDPFFLAAYSGYNWPTFQWRRYMPENVWNKFFFFFFDRDDRWRRFCRLHGANIVVSWNTRPDIDFILLKRLKSKLMSVVAIVAVGEA